LVNVSRKIRGKDVDGLDVKVDEIKQMVEDSVGVVRNMALLLRPSMLDDLGLVPPLQWQAREVSKRTGVRVKVAAGGVSEDLPEDHKTFIYRVVQEALHNCVQHSQASVVRVTSSRSQAASRLPSRTTGRGSTHNRSGDANSSRSVAKLGPPIVQEEFGIGATFARRRLYQTCSGKRMPTKRLFGRAIMLPLGAFRTVGVASA
jgi:signal transduction histidine kinase